VGEGRTEDGKKTDTSKTKKAKTKISMMAAAKEHDTELNNRLRWNARFRMVWGVFARGRLRQKTPMRDDSSAPFLHYERSVKRELLNKKRRSRVETCTIRETQSNKSNCPILRKLSKGWSFTTWSGERGKKQKRRKARTETAK